jgi:transaldolase
VRARHFFISPFFSRIDESKLNQASEKTAILSSPREQLCLAYIFHGSVCCKVKLTKSLVKNEIFAFFLSLKKYF